MKGLINVSLLLFAGLSLTSVAEAANAAGGFILINAGLGSPVARVGFIDTFGPDFSLTGQFGIDPSQNDFDFAAPGKPFHFSFTQASLSCGVTSSPLVVSLAVQGVPWGGCATLTATGQTDGPVTGPGIFSGAFSMDSSFVGNFPFTVSGSGTFTIDIPSGTSFVALAQLNFQPSTVPEPSTTSLLLLGVAGLAVVGGRRRSRTTLLQS